MPSVPDQEVGVRVHPIPAVEPSPRFAARVAAGIFAGEALVLTAVALLSSRSEGLGGGRVAIPAVCALVAAGWLTLGAILFPAAGLVGAVRDGVPQLVKRLSEAALTDTLTGLRNRLALGHELHNEVESALRSGEPLSVVIGDLDYFKSVNDRLGHKAGDEALVRAGQMLLRYRRASDSIARTGGEEFTILLPGSTEHEAYLVAERMRAAVEREFVGDPAALTFSFGIATYPDHGRTADSVLEAADQALYAAKALGRNRCVIFNAEISAIFAPEAGRGADQVQLATLVSP